VADDETQIEEEKTPEPEAAAVEETSEEAVEETPQGSDPATAEVETAPEAGSDTNQGEPELEAPPTKKQRSRRHVPRSERRRRTKPKREAASTRKAITRLPKPEGDRGQRQERRGIVISDKGDKTIVVKVDVIKLHPRYKKVVRRSVKFHAHDEANSAGIGDTVRIVETRPLSKSKHWRLAEIVEKAK
jgi:small subunit ribosomal protein S17